ncbi:C-terminal domain-containing protein [Hysterangium stoloniferum]|nr:C-terminal domain-containing protein [Hysterangium stoloniferum]
MEGQEGNEIIYDIFLDQAWSSSPLNISSYVSSWVSRRYRISKLPVTVQRGWSIQSNTVYNNPNTQATVKSILELAPALTGLTNRTGHHPTTIFYDTNSSIVAPLKLMSRQLANLSLLCDLDTLLWTNDNFLLSNWIKAVRSWAASSDDSQYADYLEYNARNQITLWGSDGEINDYASKQSAGIVGTYYLPRWDNVYCWKNTTQTAQSFNSQVINAQLLAFGKQWDSQIWGQRNAYWGNNTSNGNLHI